MNTQSLTHNKTPAMQNHSWRFGHLSAAELLPLLQQHLCIQDPTANWQLAWLNNNGTPIIGLLPKVSWQVYLEPDAPAFYQVIQKYRDGLTANRSTRQTYETWQQELIRYSRDCENYPLSNPTTSKQDLPQYHHGLIGFIGYDIAAAQLSPNAQIQAANQPLAVLGHYDIYLTLTTCTDSHANANDINSSNSLDNSKIQSHNTTTHTIWSLIIQPTTHEDDTLDHKIFAQLVSYFDALDLTISQDIAVSHESKKPLVPLLLAAQWSKSDYQQAFLQTQRYLQQGDCYQINLTQAWQGEIIASTSSKKPSQATLSLIDYLPTLQHNTQAPFAGYMSVDTTNSEQKKSLNVERFELLSCSPELFFTFTKDAETDTHYITTKPIKGTMPRGSNTEIDEALKQQLVDSDKDRSENVMIVDLLRNDLGKYAQIGSVKVPQLFAIESFSNVHHMVSTITAELKTASHPLQVLFGSLPAGSITGTPKKRAVEIIAELESSGRGAYCGTMGYMNFEGSGQWNVLIRTLQASHLADGSQAVNLWAGGGITVASACESEYQECLDKVGNLLAALAQADSL